MDDEYRNGTDEDARPPALAPAPPPALPRGPADESETPMVKIALPEGGGEAMQGTSSGGSGSAGAGRRRLHKQAPRVRRRLAAATMLLGWVALYSLSSSSSCYAFAERNKTCTFLQESARTRNDVRANELAI